LATLKISFIVDCYLLYIGDRRRISESDAEEDFEPAAISIHHLLSGNGFEELHDEQFNEIVNGVSLDPPPQATIGRCLFDDHE